MSAAFLDDIFSIICLVVMTNLAGGELNIPKHVIAPLVSAMAFVGIGVASSVFIMPRLTSYLLDSSGRAIRFFEVGTRSMGLKDEIHMFYMIVAYLLLSWLGHVIGSALLGAFVAGVLFSDVPRSHLVWEKQFKRITRWLLRIFFSATVGFTINISDLFSAQAFWRGAIMAVGPCLLTKVSAGMFVGRGRWVVGVAMMARGEFAYLVAEKAHSLDLITPSQYAVVVWSLLWATIIAPLAFDKVLKQFIQEEFSKGSNARSHRIGGDQFSGESSFIIR
jgi:Kef-type K+ transport system membrane component KefB